MKQSARVLGFVCACALAHADHCHSSYQVTVAAGETCAADKYKLAQHLVGPYPAHPEASDNPTEWKKTFKIDGNDKESCLRVDASGNKWTLTLADLAIKCEGEADPDGLKKKQELVDAAQKVVDEAKDDEPKKQAQAALKKAEEACVPLPTKWTCTELDAQCVVSVGEVSGGMEWWMWLMIVAAVSVIVGLIVWCLMCRNGDEGAQNNQGQAVTGIELAAAGS